MKQEEAGINLHEADLRDSLAVYYDLIIELEKGSNIPVYDQKAFQEFFSTDKNFDDYDELFWYMIEHFIHPDDNERIDLFREQDLERLSREGNFYTETEFRIRRGNGYIWISMVVVILCDDEGQFRYVLTLFKNINTKKCIELENTVLAQIDTMTGLYNKRNTEILIREYLHTSAEYEHCALVMIDIDNFKNINDGCGHLTGDEVLTDFSKRILNNMQKSDIAGRVGGDEFLLLMSGIESREQLEERIRTLQSKLDYSRLFDQVSVSVHCSIGVALYDREKDNYLSLYSAADKALYRAKEKGKCTYEFG